MNFTNIVNSIRTKADFVNFIHFLLEDLKSNSEDWENKTLPEYLEAIASWTDDMEGYYVNDNLPIPDNVDWKVFADILVAAKMYE
ncbi:hypothetical protein DBR11_02155 [Pedobacter sp. HMWF019]|uniref:DUF7660 family protein n=1 Tax=Pedobacter sp. HMWF019 TaxID=2056856 RepID=UPI000D37B304|nr:hypothetical protein [Pedobacter sp. HMWF019]PTT03460.1 hypothetical protein DBR11_02155 [Pedobacter sp. HMWF019]